MSVIGCFPSTRARSWSASDHARKLEALRPPSGPHPRRLPPPRRSTRRRSTPPTRSSTPAFDNPVTVNTSDHPLSPPPPPRPRLLHQYSVSHQHPTTRRTARTVGTTPTSTPLPRETEHRTGIRNPPITSSAPVASTTNRRHPTKHRTATSGPHPPTIRPLVSPNRPKSHRHLPPLRGGNPNRAHDDAGHSSSASWPGHCGGGDEGCAGVPEQWGTAVAGGTSAVTCTGGCPGRAAIALGAPRPGAAVPGRTIIG